MGTPTQIAAQVAKITGDEADSASSPVSHPEVRGYLNYPFLPNSVTSDLKLPPKISEESPSESAGSAHSQEVKLRSQPIRIEEFFYPNGKKGWLVIGTVVPGKKPWREKFSNRDEAEQRRDEWEQDRLRLARGTRLRATNLSNERLEDAENAWRVAQKLGYPSLFDAVMALKSPEAKAPAIVAEPASKTYKEIHDLFVEFHKKHASKPHSDKVRQDSYRFGEHIGWNTPGDSITSKQLHDWAELESAHNKRTFNHKVNNVCRVFSWACEPMQEFLTKNPASKIPRYKKSVLPESAKEILPVARCRELMRYLEERHPEWCWSFALMLFAGIRPGFHDGEIRKLVRAVNRHGLETYFCGDVIRITREIAKDRRSRQFKIPPNLAAWLKKYAPQPKMAKMGTKETYCAIRERFEIPYEGLRHTGISAHVSKHDRFALAAEQFGNSEKVIRESYFSRMTPAEAEEFYRIYPLD